MTSVIFNPLEEYEQKFAALHADKTNQFFEELVRRSGVDPAKNRETVRQYHDHKEILAKLNKKLKWFKVFRVLMCITVILIPVVIWKMTPSIRALREEISQADEKVAELYRQAVAQMRPLNALFTDRDALDLIESVIPLVSFHRYFSSQQEADMRLNYDFTGYEDDEQTSVDVLAGHYNENPFLFENRRIHQMGMETYHGYKTIYWTETYRDSEGKLRTQTRSETLHATVTEPKPFYRTQVVLHYCAQGGPELCFSRDAGHLDQKSDRAIERLVRRGERKLKRKTDKAIKNNDDFMAMSNSDFEVLFDALDRTDEVQFRTLFTPLAQTNMVDLIRSDAGFGDDFHFIKQYRTNQIVAEHSQGRLINLLPQDYISYSFDVIRENFLGKNAGFFKAVYFDFAPIWAIPIYQERPVHSLKPIPKTYQSYSLRQIESLANAADPYYLTHPDTKTEAILKASYGIENDCACITAHSYDIAPRVTYVTMHGGDGHWHDVPVHWDEYLPLVETSFVHITADSSAADGSAIAMRDGLYLYQS